LTTRQLHHPKPPEAHSLTRVLCQQSGPTPVEGWTKLAAWLLPIGVDLGLAFGVVLFCLAQPPPVVRAWLVSLAVASLQEPFLTLPVVLVIRWLVVRGLIRPKVGE
jgi:hypothetical protein